MRRITASAIEKVHAAGRPFTRWVSNDRYLGARLDDRRIVVSRASRDEYAVALVRDLGGESVLEVARAAAASTAAEAAKLANELGGLDG